MSYPKIIKEAALEKMFHTDLSLCYISDELGIPRATLHGWKKQFALVLNDYGLKVHRLFLERLKITSCACHLDSRDRYKDVAY